MFVLLFAHCSVNDSEVLGSRAIMVCVPTTSGTGAEVTPFAVVKDDKTGKKHTIVRPWL